jgi:uncharacterized protein
MDIKHENILNNIRETVREKMSGEGTGHDWFHVERVVRLAKRIAGEEGGMDDFVVEAGALLHDIADHKFHGGDDTIGPQTARQILEEQGVEPDRTDAVVKIVEEISFKGAGVPTPMSSNEGKAVQDADRLDAIGAIGIARTFAYGGSKNRPIYDPNIKAVCHTSFAAYKTSTAPTINHFYEKLLLLKDRMNTQTGRKIAEGRHAFMEDFLTRFYHEWDARD